MTEIRGMIQSASSLTGTLSNQGSITGDIAGLRGLKGDKGDPGEKGDTGDTGATGNGISSAILNSDYTLTLNFTDGTSYTTAAIRGEKGDTGDTGLKGDTGDTGNGIASIAKTGTQGLVDTYTITFTNGTTTTFTVTNGQNGSGSVADVWVNNVSVLDGDTAKVTVPTKTSDITNDSGFITTETDPTVSAWAKQSTKPSYSYSEISGTPTLADVATTGDYDDLINTPNVATVVELTQAQYDALTPAEKNNGTVYCVSDASGTYLTASEVSYGSSSVQDALDDIDERTTTVTSATTLLNDSIAVTGTYNWQQLEGTININGYKYLRMYVYIHGTIRVSNIIPMEVLNATANLEYCTIYWDANNLGCLQIRRDGHWWVDAKAYDKIFYYTIIGYK